jgi:hypothetical protein
MAYLSGVKTGGIQFQTNTPFRLYPSRFIILFVYFIYLALTKNIELKTKYKLKQSVEKIGEETEEKL